MKTRILSLIFLLTLLGLTYSCSTNDGGKAHMEAVALNDSIKNMYSESDMHIKNMKTIKIMLENKAQESHDADSLLTELILSINEDIAVCEGLLEKHSVLINQHNDYLEQHENTALAVDQIEMQHEQIRKDFHSVNQDFLFIRQKLDQASAKAKEFINIEEVKVISQMK